MGASGIVSGFDAITYRWNRKLGWRCNVCWFVFLDLRIKEKTY